jgi:hypothetical protein
MLAEAGQDNRQARSEFWLFAIGAFDAMQLHAGAMLAVMLKWDAWIKFLRHGRTFTRAEERVGPAWQYLR